MVYVLIAYQRLFNAKAILVDKSKVVIPFNWKDKRVHAFHEGISSKVNVIARIEFELAFFEVAFQHVSHYATGITFGNYLIWNQIYIYIYHLVVSPARILLTLSCHSSLSFIAFGRSSGLHPVSSQSDCM